MGKTQIVTMQTQIDTMAHRQAEDGEAFEVLSQASVSVQQQLAQQSQLNELLLSEVQLMRLESWGWRAAQVLGVGLLMLWIARCHSQLSASLLHRTPSPDTLLEDQLETELAAAAASAAHLPPISKPKKKRNLKKSVSIA